MISKTLLPGLFILFCCSLPATAAELSVFAASSLTDALGEIAKRYELQHPEDQVRLNFAGSQTLAMQIEQGAPAELFISANHAVMERLQNRGLVSAVQPLLINRLALATRSDLQPPLKSIHDLTRSGLLLIIGKPQVPVGYYTRELFTNLAAAPEYGTAMVTQIKENIVSEEGRVKAIIAKLLLGEADAGIVYQSDLSNNLRSIPLPEKQNPQAIYPLAKVEGGTSHGERFYAFLLSSEATEIFHRHRFLTRSEL